MHNITTANERHTTYEFFLNYIMIAAEWKLNEKNNKLPSVINALDRSSNQTLIRKYSFILFKQTNFYCGKSLFWHL